ARFHAVILALLFACVGVLMSWDLAELFGFWAIGGAMTYLLLAHRWGLDEPARRARVALALPFLTDLCLLCGIAWLYARYGTQNLSTLLPILHTNPGWTVRSLVVGSVLLFIGIAGRLALWPFNSWITQTSLSAPAAAWVIVQAAWSVVAIVVLYRVMPIFLASNPQTLDRKSTRLNSSHLVISYAVFCLKKKKEKMKGHSPTSWNRTTPITILVKRPHR